MNTFRVIIVALAFASVACSTTKSPEEPSQAEVSNAFSRLQIIKPTPRSAFSFTNAHGIALSNKLEETKAIAFSSDASPADKKAAYMIMDRTTRQLEHEASLASASPQVKVLNGRPVTDDLFRSMFSYQVALYYAGFENPRYGLFCGGTLIDATWVLTAAHCFTAQSKSDEFEVYVGSPTLSAGGQPVDLESLPAGIIRHPQYNPASDEFDIALVKLKAPVNASQKIDILDPTTERQMLASLPLSTVSGWGETGSGTGATDRLQYAPNLRIVSNVDCQAKYNSLPVDKRRKIADTMLCAGDGSSDACFGDSGGPLGMRSGGALRLEGIVSWGQSCDGRSSGFPGVYTRVPAFIGWIKCSQMKGAACPGD